MDKTAIRGVQRPKLLDKVKQMDNGSKERYRSSWNETSEIEEVKHLKLESDDAIYGLIEIESKTLGESLGYEGLNRIVYEHCAEWDKLGT